MSASVGPNNRITLTRGDSLALSIDIYSGGEIFEPEEGDEVRIAIKRTVDDDEPLVIKQADMETLIAVINPEDTKDLPFGSYVYDVEYKSANGYVDTFITPTQFILTEEVY